MKTKIETLQSPLINLRFLIRKAILKTDSDCKYNSVYRYINMNGQVRSNQDYQLVVDTAYDLLFEKIQEVKKDRTKIRSRIFKLKAICELYDNTFNWHIYDMLYGRVSKDTSLENEILRKFFKHFEHKKYDKSTNIPQRQSNTDNQS